MTQTNNRKNILWTAADVPLPKSLWDRLEGLGYRVLLGEGGDNGPGKIQAVSPRLWVGEMEGDAEAFFADLQGVRRECPDLPIIILSPQPSIEEAVTAIRLGVADYLPDDVEDERLWLTIEGALSRDGPHRGIPSLGPARPEKSKGPVAVDSGMKNILKLAKKVAPSRSTVLIRGESGTGKEVVARYIHRNSDRKGAPFIAVNCAALPENLLESELFGHERGAFTGAVTRKKGKFELADGGTLLLDEISEMAVSIQAKLLRVLQEREIDRVGGQYAIPVDVRVIATTNRDLEEETRKGNFRLDLFYRLNVVPVLLPPLRKRPEDITALAGYFLETHCSLNQCPPKRLSGDGENYLKKRSWPGNVRELENLMERATLLVDSEIIGSGDLESISSPEEPGGLPDPDAPPVQPLKDLEKTMIFRALDDHNGNRTHAAKVLGISVRTLRNKLHEYQMETEGEPLAARG